MGAQFSSNSFTSLLGICLNFLVPSEVREPGGGACGAVSAAQPLARAAAVAENLPDLHQVWNGCS